MNFILVPFVRILNLNFKTNEFDFDVKIKGCHRLRGRKAGTSLYLDVHIEVSKINSLCDQFMYAVSILATQVLNISG